MRVHANSLLGVPLFSCTVTLDTLKFLPKIVHLFRRSSVLDGRGRTATLEW